MNCKNCGHPLDKNYLLCRSCGEPIKLMETWEVKLWKLAMEREIALEAKVNTLREFVEYNMYDPSDCSYKSCENCPSKNNCYTYAAQKLLDNLDK